MSLVTPMLTFVFSFFNTTPGSLKICSIVYILSPAALGRSHMTAVPWNRNNSLIISNRDSKFHIDIILLIQGLVGSIQFTREARKADGVFYFFLNMCLEKKKK